MTRVLSPRRALVVAACLTMLAAPLAAQQTDPKQQGSAPAFVSAKAIADQLGAKLQPRDDDELRLGASFTAVLHDPAKLAELGLKGLHDGARVTVGRITPDKLRVEADEMDPVPTSVSGTFKIDANGRLVAIPK